jgi:signal transduction histidine kinase
MSLRLAARSARLRLTLLFSGMFLALGTAIIVIVFLLASGGAVVSRSAVAPAPGGAVHTVVTQQHSADVDRLLAASWVTLALTAAASALLGWFAAGRVLRPLRQMTATTRTISAGNLHERLALAGPEDEFRQLGDTIDELLARLERSFAAQRRFVANAAHELRTPLTLERTLVQVALADPYASVDRLRVTCEELLASGRDQERLLDALLTLATSERGLERREPIDLAGLAGRAIDVDREELGSHGLELIAELGPASVAGDAALLERLVANLLDNAGRYNHAGGRVELTTGTDGHSAVITVVNTGRAIPASEIERLFEPFQRLDEDRTGSDGHRGLGLSIVRAIAAAHDGTATASPRAGGGLVVTVSLPARARSDLGS